MVNAGLCPYSKGPLVNTGFRSTVICTLTACVHNKPVWHNFTVASGLALHVPSQPEVRVATKFSHSKLVSVVTKYDCVIWISLHSFLYSTVPAFTPVSLSIAFSPLSITKFSHGELVSVVTKHDSAIWISSHSFFYSTAPAFALFSLSIAVCCFLSPH